MRVSRRRFFHDVIAAVLDRVPETLEIWFHGSRATGKARRSSDWDFLVVVPEETTPQRWLELCLACGPLASLDRIDGRVTDIQATKPSEALPKGVYVQPLYWAHTEGQRIYCAAPPQGTSALTAETGAEHG